MGLADLYGERSRRESEVLGKKQEPNLLLELRGRARLARESLLFSTGLSFLGATKGQAMSVREPARGGRASRPVGLSYVSPIRPVNSRKTSRPAWRSSKNHAIVRIW